MKIYMNIYVNVNEHHDGDSGENVYKSSYENLLTVHGYSHKHSDEHSGERSGEHSDELYI